MPLFSFKCEQCSTEFNRLSPTPYAQAPCPTCNALADRIPVMSSLIDTPSNLGRKLARQFGQKKQHLLSKQGIKG